MTQVNQTVPIDTTTTPEMLDRDPQSVYRRLRRDMPIARIASIDRIILTKADDTYLAKTDTQHFGSSDTTTPMQRAFGGHTLMRKDGEAHQVERAAMTETFRISAARSHWQGVFDKIAQQSVGALPQGETVDLRSALAVPMTVAFLKQVLGIEPEPDGQLFDWANALITGAMNAGFSEDVFAVSDRANDEMNACFDRMIEQHRADPNPSVLAVMANARDTLPRSQIRTNMKICIGGAVVETRDALLSTLHGLLENPDQIRYCQETGHWDLATEEGLRWVAPIQTSPRIVLRDYTLRGVTLPAGETVLVSQSSANYDEDYWHEPERFDIHRTGPANQTFGLGPHRCMGGDIYRQFISRSVLPALFDRFPQMHPVAGKKVEFRGFGFRGPTSLPVQL
ncbi:cytochrome P450 [Neptunicoccus cionae]|uniref:cytochrome P450 n=1 Tax=Neptunicoccus cionae TaxID=2035344 RepID=UPI000C77613F|nr:cytochrome P450 [Amylibacter cionae]PLS21404.1 cytochrome [Amylibacter cionae]